MKNWTFALLLGLTSLISIPAFAQEAEAEDAEFRAYCDRTLRHLERARGQASDASLNGDFNGAVTILLNGLKANYTQRYGDLNPITLRLIVHAYNLGNTLKDQVAKDIRGTKATAIALESFYDLIFDTAANIDYRHYSCQSRRFCRYSRTLEFEARMLDMVQSMLTLVNSSLLIHHGHRVSPLGPTSAYLVASQQVAGVAYYELSQLVYADAQACQILDLKDISNDLTTFNRSNASELTKKGKLVEVHASINDVIHGLAARRHCR